MEALRQIRPAQKHRISAFIDSLEENPFQEGDYTDRDETDRPIHVKVIAQYAVSFWSDHAVSEVEIVDIRRADSA